MGYLFGQYKRLTGGFTGVLTGKGIQFGGSLIRPEATGYGCVYFTEEMLKTKGNSIKGKTVAWIGDSNKMCNTWLQAAEVLDFHVHVSTPPGYEIEPERAGLYGTDHFAQFADPMDACRGVDLVTTDVWTSMGFEAENDERLKAFADWQVDGDMMRVAHPGALFMHCLPAHRGEEVTAEVIDGPHSVVWDEAENRLHVQKALMEYLHIGRIETK